MRTLGMLLLAAVGCASEPPCEFYGRTYVTTTTELSGNCGPVPREIGTPIGKTREGCVSVDTPATGECAMGHRVRCNRDDGLIMTSQYVLRRDEDDESYSGTVDVTVADQAGKIVCRSLYDLKLDRQ